MKFEKGMLVAAYEKTLRYRGIVLNIVDGHLLVEIRSRSGGIGSRHWFHPKACRILKPKAKKVAREITVWDDHNLEQAIKTRIGCGQKTIFAANRECHSNGENLPTALFREVLE